MNAHSEIGHNGPPEGVAAVIAAMKAGEDVTPALEAIQAQQAASIDLTTDKGRKEIASRAYAISKLKGEVEAAGKDLVSGWKSQAKTVDGVRAKCRDWFDDFRDQTRQPLTDWEAAEETRKDKLRDRLAAIDAGRADQHCQSDQIISVRDALSALVIDGSWGEYQAEAKIKLKSTLEELERNLATAQARESEALKVEAERAELAQLREDAAKRQREDEVREAEAQEEARKIEAARLEVEQTKQRETEKKQAAKKAAVDATARAKAVAEDKQRQHDAEIMAAKEREVRAAEVERQRIEAERKAERDAKAKREADEAHVAKIQFAIQGALFSASGDRRAADKIAAAIFDGKIPHLEVKL